MQPVLPHKLPRPLALLLLVACLPFLLATDAPPAFLSQAAPRLPGFAAQLAEMPPVESPSGWAALPRDAAWDAIATAQPFTRQPARWAYALSLIGQGSGGEALGVLDTMALDDPDLLIVPGFRLARGVALVRLDRPDDALTMLGDPLLGANAEACAWRLLAKEQAGRPFAALAELRCALRAINARSQRSAAPFILASARAAIALRQHARALAWLKLLPDRNSTANLLRGEAYLALGQVQEGRHRLDRAKLSGSPAERAAAQVELVAALLPRGLMNPREAIGKLDALRFTWRGDATEEKALRLAYGLAERMQDGRGLLTYGGPLIRYFDLGPSAGRVLAECQRQLFAVLAPESGLKLADAAGLFWSNRDLAPPGSDGDRLLLLLADRLAETKLYAQAADLLGYQMRERALDIEKGPVSERAARYHILAGQPDKALLVLRESDQPAYPPAMAAARHKMEAIALYRLGKTEMALALLEDMPGAQPLRSEMLWRKRDWQRLAADEAALPAPRAMTPVAQAVVLRQAVALAMLGREDQLARLRARYGAAFAPLPARDAFALLTGPISGMSGDGIARAMAAIPSASVVGADEAMLEAPPRPAAKGSI